MQDLGQYNNHLHYFCFETKQGDYTSIFVGSMKFRELSQYYTATPRVARKDDPFYDDCPNPKDQLPQRPANKDRLKEISDFVEVRLANTTEDKKLTVFPNAVILGLLTDIEEHDAPPDNPTPSAAHLLPNGIDDHCRVILLPRKEASLFVIDGQHRLKGMDALAKRLKDRIAVIRSTGGVLADALQKELEKCEILLGKLLDFDVLVSLLVDFDLKEQALVFADVNFNQKPVARSFYYDIFGAFESDEFTEIGFCHDLALHLNNSSLSPLKGMIKLLGSGSGLVSQAFIVAKFILLIDPEESSKAAFRYFLIERRKGNTEASRQFASIVRNYFSAVKNEFEYAWAFPVDNKFSMSSYPFILCKSMVMSGLLAILGDIYRLILLDFGFGREPEIAAAEVLVPDLFAEFLRTIDAEGRKDATKSVFAKKAPWGIGGSAVLERAIYLELRTKVFEAYVSIERDKSCRYQKVCAGLSGHMHALRLVNAHSLETEGDFWKKVEMNCDGNWSGVS